MATVAFIGVGRMGAGMAARLLEGGHTVVVYDPSAEAVEAMVRRGAEAASSIKEAASRAETVMLSLPNPAIVRNAVFGVDGLLTAEPLPRAVIDLSTIDPTTAKHLGEQLEREGVRFMDAPVSGGVIAAAEGSLLIMVGAGDEDLAEQRPLLELIGSRIVHCGPVGAGQTVKLSHNMLTAINTLAAGEVLTASVAAGADLDVLMRVFTDGLAGSKVLGHFERTLFTEDRPHLFALDLMHKDVSLFLDEFKDSVLPLSQFTKQSYNAAQKQGLGPKDSTSVNEIYEAYYGVELNRKAK